MKYSEIKEKSVEELKKSLEELDLEMNKFYKASPEKTFQEKHKRKEIRRSRARILTFLSQGLVSSNNQEQDQEKPEVSPN